MFGSIQVTAGLLLLGVVYFILGYLLFAVVSLALRLCITGDKVRRFAFGHSIDPGFEVASCRSAHDGQGFAVRIKDAGGEIGYVSLEFPTSYWLQAHAHSRCCPCLPHVQSVDCPATISMSIWGKRGVWQ